MVTLRNCLFQDHQSVKHPHRTIASVYKLGFSRSSAENLNQHHFQFFWNDTLDFSTKLALFAGKKTPRNTYKKKGKRMWWQKLSSLNDPVLNDPNETTDLLLRRETVRKLVTASLCSSWCFLVGRCCHIVCTNSTFYMYNTCSRSVTVIISDPRDHSFVEFRNSSRSCFHICYVRTKWNRINFLPAVRYLHRIVRGRLLVFLCLMFLLLLSVLSAVCVRHFFFIPPAGHQTLTTRDDEMMSQNVTSSYYRIVRISAILLTTTVWLHLVNPILVLLTLAILNELRCV